MRILDSVIALSLTFGISAYACKTRRDTVDLKDEAYVQSASKNAAALSPDVEGSESAPTSLMQLNAIDLPSNPTAYDRVALTLSSSGRASEDIYDYTLGDTMDLRVGSTYKLLVEAYAGDTVIYSNAGCDKGLYTFKAKTGINAFTLPLCAAKAQTTPDPALETTPDDSAQVIPLTP